MLTGRLSGLVAAAVLAATATPALADSEIGNTVYAGLEAGSSVGFEHHSGAGRAFLGYQPWSFLSLEVGGGAYGHLTNRFDWTNPTEYPAKGTIEILDTTLLLHTPSYHRWSGFVKGGVNWSRLELQDVATVHGNHQATMGLGLQYDLSPHWFARLEGQRFSDVGSIDRRVTATTLGIAYRFGVKTPAPMPAPVMAPPPPPPPAVVAAPPPPPAPVVEADSDGDGVPDSRDQCPATPRGTKVDRVGCPCNVSLEVHFAFDSAVLTAEDRAALDGLVPTLKTRHFQHGEVAGHTDSTGTPAHNQTLSERRAQAVADYLAGHGLPGAALRVVGYGENQPAASNATKEGRAHNRRVTFNREDCSR